MAFFPKLTRPGFIKLYFLLWWLKILLMPPTDPGVKFLSLLCGPSGIKDLKENMDWNLDFICWKEWAHAANCCGLRFDLSLGLNLRSNILLSLWLWKSHLISLSICSLSVNEDNNAVVTVNNYSQSCGQSTGDPQGLVTSTLFFTICRPEESELYNCNPNLKLPRTMWRELI